MVGYFRDVSKEDIDNVAQEYPYLKRMTDKDDSLKAAKKNMQILLKREYPDYDIVLTLSRTTTTDSVIVTIPDYGEENKLNKNDVYRFLSDRFKDTVRDIDNDADLPPSHDRQAFHKAFGSATYINVRKAPATEKQMALYTKNMLERETAHIEENASKPSRKMK